MKIFDASGKVNFVDGRRFVGFDMEPQCCEDYGWKFINKNGDDVDLTDEQLRGLSFEASTFKDSDDGIFNLVNWHGDCQYRLVLYNIHNGYYAHDIELGQIINTYSL